MMPIGLALFIVVVVAALCFFLGLTRGVEVEREAHGDDAVKQAREEADELSDQLSAAIRALEAYDQAADDLLPLVDDTEGVSTHSGAVIRWSEIPAIAILREAFETNATDAPETDETVKLDPSDVSVAASRSSGKWEAKDEL